MVTNGVADDELLFPPGFEPENIPVENYAEPEDLTDPEILYAPASDAQEKVYPDWFPKAPEPEPRLATQRFYKLPNKECVGRIISWKYDHNNKVIMVKRTDGVQYFSRSFKRISSLPKCEVNHLGQKRLINYSGDGMMDWFDKIVEREVSARRFCYLRETFPTRRVDNFDIHPITNQPRVILTWPRAHCKRTIPLEKLPMRFSRFINFWRYNGFTGEAEIHCYDRDSNDDIIWNHHSIIYVYDPLSLINLAKEDLETLHSMPIIFTDQHDDHLMAAQFKRVVDVCIAEGIHAGGRLPGQAF